MGACTSTAVGATVGAINRPGEVQLETIGFQGAKLRTKHEEKRGDVRTMFQKSWETGFHAWRSLISSRIMYSPDVT